MWTGLISVVMCGALIGEGGPRKPALAGKGVTA